VGTGFGLGRCTTEGTGGSHSSFAGTGLGLGRCTTEGTGGSRFLFAGTGFGLSRCTTEGTGEGRSLFVEAGWEGSGMVDSSEVETGPGVTSMMSVRSSSFCAVNILAQSNQKGHGGLTVCRRELLDPFLL